MTVPHSRAVPVQGAGNVVLRRIACGRGCARCNPCAFVFEQDPARRCVDIVELTGPNGPRKGCDCGPREQQGEWENEVQHGHGATSLRSSYAARAGSAGARAVGDDPRNARDRSELASTVSELSGMTSAAISGWMSPLTARPPATRLYASENLRLRRILS